MKDEELTCTLCGDPVKAFAIEGPTGAVVCLDCLNTLFEMMTAEIVQQQSQHSTLN